MPDFEKRTIGDATLYCGDSLALLRAGVFGDIGAIVSDPPYGIGYQHGGGCGKTGLCGMVKRAVAGIEDSNTDSIIGNDQPFDTQPWLDAAPTARADSSQPGASLILLWGADHYMQRLPEGGTLLAWATPSSAARSTRRTLTRPAGASRRSMPGVAWRWLKNNCDLTPIILAP